MNGRPPQWCDFLGPAIFVVGLASCTSADSTPALERIENKLDQIESRLTAQQERIDAIAADVDAATKAKEEAAAARSTSLEEKREERRQRREALLGRDERPAPLPSSGESASERAIEGAEAAIECPDHELPRWSCRFDPTFLDSLLADPAQLTRQARIVPSVRDEVSVGFKLYGIRPGSLPKLLGFKNGDTIVSVNGDPMGSLDQAMAAYTSLRVAKRVEIELLRKGTPAWLTVEFAR